MPAISVVLPFRDAGAFLGDAVRSILAQKFADFELLAIDNGSSDGSAAIVEALARNDRRVRLLSAPGPSLPNALNRGIAEASGRYIARMDGDDIALPARFGAQVAALERDSRLVLVGSAVERIDRAGRVLDIAWYPSTPSCIRRALSDGVPCFCHPATMVRRDGLQRVGGYAANAAVNEDFDLWRRLAGIGDLANLDRPLLQYRLHAGSVGFARAREQATSLLGAASSRAGREPSETFVEVAAWWVDNAATAGLHRTARRLAAELAAAAPGGRTRWTERRLRESAALLTASRGDRLQALRYLAGIGFTRESGPPLWTLVLRPPVLEARQRDPEPAGGAAGYLDRIHLYEGRRRVLLFGWVPVTRRGLPDRIALVAPCRITPLSLRLVRRPDVARAIDARHLYAGVRIEAALERALETGGGGLRVWCRSPEGAWRRLIDDSTSIDAPQENS